MVYKTIKTIWRLPEVKACTGLPRSSIYAKMSRGEFPLNIKLGPRAVGWDADEVIAWINEQIGKSRKGFESQETKAFDTPVSGQRSD